MPYLEQNNLYELWDLKIDYSDQELGAATTPVDLFLCPTRHTLDNALTDDTVLINDQAGGGGG